MKQNRIAMALLLGLVGSAWAQTPLTSAQSGPTTPTRSPFRTITSTQYTEHSELFAEFRPLLLNVPARFTAHLTQVGESFKPYTDAVVTFTLMIDGKTAWQQTQQHPVAPGTYRFPVKSEIAGKGTVTITLKMPTYSEQFVIDTITVYADEAAALASQANYPANEPKDKVRYPKEKSWVETFATATVTQVKKAEFVPQTAIQTDNGVLFVYVQEDPEHFRKQVVQPGKRTGKGIKITSGLQSGDRIVTVGADKIK
ncbi:hypothetical protein [Larkinella sp. C7]|uniref:hypothetical protein n=1 Tax=Larkinella sp. C7 TaxID=2576607 RepID=UPI0011111A34|nr:hypothetical protein [Larkinella sp. C7]